MHRKLLQTGVLSQHTHAINLCCHYYITCHFLSTERSYGNELTHSSTANEDNGRELRDISRGMSQSDFMLRQRYVENSGCQNKIIAVHVLINTIFHRYKNSFYQSVSAASHPAELHGGDVRHFVQEQRKIIANFKAQPWPMQMKMAARKYK